MGFASTVVVNLVDPYTGHTRNIKTIVNKIEILGIRVLKLCLESQVG